MSKITFYCYLFFKSYDKIGRYDILWKTGDRFLLKYTPLDKEYTNPSQYIAVKIFRSLTEAMSYIIIELRNLEIESRVYQNLNTSQKLNEVYDPLVHQLERSIQNNIKSFSIFGNISKFSPQTAARRFLKSMGYFLVVTKPPHLYVLKDVIEREQADSEQTHSRSEHL
jgi:hypothetical protein